MLEAGTGIEGQVRSGSRARQADALHIAFGPYAEVIREFSLRNLITYRAGKKTHSNPFGVKPSCSIEEDDHEPQNDLDISLRVYGGDDSERCSPSCATAVVPMTLAVTA